MEFVNIIDDKNRFVRLEIYNNGREGQMNSHTYSYLYQRETYQELGRIMGFDREDFEEYVLEKD